jgi:hypothetical protein
MRPRPLSESGGSSHYQRGSRRSRVRWDWGAIGCVVAVLIFAAADGGLHLPPIGVVGLAAISTLALIVGFGWWHPVVHGASRKVRRAVHDQIRTGYVEAAARSCAQAAEALTNLLPDPPHHRHRHLQDLANAFRHRGTLTRYRGLCRHDCLAALSDANKVLDVPRSISEYADDPRSIKELYWLVVWLLTAGEQLRSELSAASSSVAV